MFCHGDYKVIKCCWYLWKNHFISTRNHVWNIASVLHSSIQLTAEVFLASKWPPPKHLRVRKKSYFPVNAIECTWEALQRQEHSPENARASSQRYGLSRRRDSRYISLFFKCSLDIRFENAGRDKIKPTLEYQKAFCHVQLIILDTSLFNHQFCAKCFFLCIRQNGNTKSVETSFRCFIWQWIFQFILTEFMSQKVWSIFSSL